mgnify:CR=1 FL=1
MLSIYHFKPFVGFEPLFLHIFFRKSLYYQRLQAIVLRSINIDIVKKSYNFFLAPAVSSLVGWYKKSTLNFSNQL